MADNNELKKKKKIRMIIVICIIIAVIAILFGIYSLFHRGVIGKSSVINQDKLNGVYIADAIDYDLISFSVEKCVDEEICITEVEVYPDGNKGMISYTVENLTSTAKTGRFHVSIGGYEFIFPYNNVPASGKKTEVYGYQGYSIDFEVSNDLTVEAEHSTDHNLMYETFNNDDKESIIVK